MLVTKENYYSQEANMEYMGSSQYKSFLTCEAKAMAELTGFWAKKDKMGMLAGKYGHAWNEGCLEQFKEEHPEIFTKKGDLRAEFVKMDNIIEFVSKDPVFMGALQGLKEVIFTAEMFGSKWKILIDCYLPAKKRITDLKFLKKIKDRIWNDELKIYENPFEAYGYYTQMAIYSAIEKLAHSREEYFKPYMVVASKEEYTDKEIITISSQLETHEQFITRELLMVQRHMPRILEVKSGKATPTRCGICDYCRATKMLKGPRHYTDFEV